MNIDNMIFRGGSEWSRDSLDKIIELVEKSLLLNLHPIIEQELRDLRIFLDPDCFEPLRFGEALNFLVDGVTHLPDNTSDVVRAVLGKIIKKMVLHLSTEAFMKKVYYEQSLTDPLTGLLNRRGIAESWLLHYRRIQSGSAQFLLLYGDVNHFGKVNKAAHHDTGDRLISLLASTMSQVFHRGNDIATFGRLDAEGPLETPGRPGGDEVVISVSEDITDARKTISNWGPNTLLYAARMINVALREFEEGLTETVRDYLAESAGYRNTLELAVGGIWIPPGHPGHIQLILDGRNEVQVIECPPHTNRPNHGDTALHTYLNLADETMQESKRLIKIARCAGIALEL